MDIEAAQADATEAAKELLAGFTEDDLKPEPRKMNFAALRSLALSKGDGGTLTEDETAVALLKARVLRLDWQGFNTCDGLDAFTECRDLYLQYNYLSAVPCLEFHLKLEFLALGHNEITTVENLRHLNNLAYLDLSHNRIADFDTDELPASLRHLDLSGNPCCGLPDYRELLLELMPGLTTLDGLASEDGDGVKTTVPVETAGRGPVEANVRVVAVASSAELIKAHDRMARCATTSARQEYRTRRDELIRRSHDRAEEQREVAQTPRSSHGPASSSEGAFDKGREEKVADDGERRTSETTDEEEKT